jgi:DNA (cytosine-5)-methyltransferase 1
MADLRPTGGRPRAAEFFAGIGLVRRALEEAGVDVVFANDIEAFKRDLYVANFGDEHFVLDDVRNIRGRDVPEIDIATASFPCTDLSLAGNRAGLEGEQSGMFWEFARILREMGGRRPRVCLLENVPGFATSKNGEDLRAAIAELNELGYACDLFVVNARHFVPQSRPRLFIVASQDELAEGSRWGPSALRPAWVRRFVETHPELRLQARDLRLPPRAVTTLADVVERLPPRDARWWDAERVERFVGALAPLQAARLERLTRSPRLVWATAYRRTRGGKAVWEIRPDEIAGCLRTARGGSSKQALVQAARGEARVRWMTPREYARLQGAGDFKLDAATPAQQLFGLGDAVCVPVVAWIATSYLVPLVRAGRDGESRRDIRHGAAIG